MPVAAWSFSHSPTRKLRSSVDKPIGLAASSASWGIAGRLQLKADPFVFGRGGEEVLACTQAGIPCSVVPGLSSITAAPALAGIPLTHRGVAQSFTVVSGHLPPGDPDSTIDWAGLAGSVESLILLMAVGNLSRIAAYLVNSGRPPATPVACIQHAATPRHRVIRCTLADLAASEVDLQVENPAVIIVGPTVPVLPAGDGDDSL